MAPEYVSDDNEEPIIIHGQKIKKKRGKVCLKTKRSSEMVGQTNINT